jgi:predicted Zn-dependent protease
MKSVWQSLPIALSFLLAPSGTIAAPLTQNAIAATESDLGRIAEAETPEPPSVIIDVEEIPVEPEPPGESPETVPENTETESLNYETLGFTAEEIARYEKLVEADRLYISGNVAAAETLYREVKPPFEAELKPAKPTAGTPAIFDPAELPRDGAVFWRQSAEGLESGLYTKIFAPLELLVERYPQFIPGQVRYVRALKRYDRAEQAEPILEQLIANYPDNPDVLLLKIEAQQEREEWLEASLAARQFATMNPQHPRAAEFLAVAEENFERYQGELRSQMAGNAILNVITGALGYAFLGDLFGPISAIDTTVLMLQGESAVGDRIAHQILERAPLLEDESVLAYVREVGQKLAVLGGRDEFEYEFYVIMDDSLNAFALPGGKVFIHAGAIAKTHSEAELAGLLSHELAHAILSHGFQLVTQGNLTANVTQFIPFVGGTAGTLLTLNYSRDMERQADILGTRVLAIGGYAADGLRNLMVTLEKEDDDPEPPAWLSTHPDPDNRIRYLEELIVSGGYNRYAFEGVERHQKIRQRAIELLEQYKENDE